jgi:hypothetical protein
MEAQQYLGDSQADHLGACQPQRPPQPA